LAGILISDILDPRINSGRRSREKRSSIGRFSKPRDFEVPAAGIPGAGVLLAIPSLIASGLLSVAQHIYGTLGPEF